MKKKILAICGSTRQHSTNHSLIKAIEALFAVELELVIFEGIADLPHFIPDKNDEYANKEVLAFRQQIQEADGVLFCTPEYAHGVPGSLKNAIDWTVSSNEFSNKPTALITASTDGQWGHKSLLETLKVIGARSVDQLQLLIQFAATKISREHIIHDAHTLNEIQLLMHHFLKVINENMDEGIKV